ncbi:MAG TPA: hypothetical protein VE262_06395 [Blastocatellia bacterium]|nr:hypothetical protein [Blastocatellia bacterium]
MANPLTFVVQLDPNQSPTKLLEYIAANQAQIDNALNTVGTVHYARFIFMNTNNPLTLQPDQMASNATHMSVITAYDGDFDKYIQDFTNQLSGLFDALLSFTVDGQHIPPVSQNLKAFEDYIHAHNLSDFTPNNSMYSAYTCIVQQVRTLNC